MDLLRWPIVGTWARHRHARLMLQLPLLAVAILVVWHGLLGPQLAPRNLSTVLSWVHYRGLLLIAILAVGNLFCAACPMILVRDTARRAVHPAWRWPRALRTKWPALVLFVGVLFVYELFDLWSLPRATAWLVIGYFAAALIVDVCFAGASFCKYICPIGQFSFLAATMSPAELQIRDGGTCRTCRTVDCIRGRREPAIAPAPVRITQRGCELNLFLPAKVGNLDCTLCLDCVHACPHDNIALASRLPGEELADTRRRSGIGWIARRSDIAALAVLFTFAALVNALAMTGPGYDAERWLAATAGTSSEAVALALLFGVALVGLPVVLLAAASSFTRVLTGGAETRRAIVMRYAYALVPLGLGIWAAHYGFHFLTGALTVVPVAQSAAIDLAGWAFLGEPQWTWVGAQPGTVFPFQIGCVLLGTAGAAATAYRVATRSSPNTALAASLPWTVVIVGLAACAVWIFAQPMEMRGVGMPG